MLTPELSQMMPARRIRRKEAIGPAERHQHIRRPCGKLELFANVFVGHAIVLIKPGEKIKVHQGRRDQLSPILAITQAKNLGWICGWEDG
jgi:hypothetical protein